MELLENESLFEGRYRILKKLGQGGSSVVYLAIDLESDSPVTIKTLRRDVFSKRDMEKLVKDECGILRMLDHPFIPKVVESGSDFFVMEYMPGNSLEKHIKKHGRLKEKAAVKIALELLDILSVLHNRKTPVIYRDLKPSNIIIRPDGHVALIDFGAARLYDRNDNKDTTNLGTSGFAAPEQYGSLGQTDPRTDVFCFGKTLLQMVASKCSPELMAIVDKCTRADREDRFKGCNEIKKAFKVYPKKRFIRLALQNLKLLFAATAASLVISFGITHYEAALSYASYDAELRIPAVRERLGNVGIRIRNVLMEKNLWTFEIPEGEN